MNILQIMLDGILTDLGSFVAAAAIVIAATCLAFVAFLFYRYDFVPRNHDKESDHAPRHQGKQGD